MNLSTSSISEDRSVPCLIILTTWTGAYAQHISKYVSKYSTLFPRSRILVITTSAKDIVWRRSACKRERLQLAVEYNLEIYKFSNVRLNGILLYIFLEGGANKACELATAYYAVTGTHFPILAMFLDSTPGYLRFRRLCSALAKLLPQIPILEQFAIVMAVVVLGLA